MLRNGKLEKFQLPPEVKIFKWPALCTDDTVYICKDDKKPAESLTGNDYTRIDLKVSSCVWFGWTLFAVHKDKLFALGKEGPKRLIAKLPTATFEVNVC